MSVTLICIAIPSIIPLYKRIRKSVSTNRSGLSGGYKKSQGTSDGPHELGRVKPAAGMSHSNEADERKTNVNGPFTEVNIMYESEGNKSDEAILPINNTNQGQPSGIVVTEEVSVSVSRTTRQR